MERSDVWLLSGYTFRGVAVLFRPATLPQSTPILLHISAIVCSLIFIAVEHHRDYDRSVVIKMKTFAVNLPTTQPGSEVDQVTGLAAV